MYSENTLVCYHNTPLCPSNIYIQATLGIGSVNFCTVDVGGAFFNSFYCVPRVLPGTLVLRCTLFICCAKQLCGPRELPHVTRLR